MGNDEPAASTLSELLFDDPVVARCLVAPDGRVLRVNDGWLRLTGRSRDEVIGEHVRAPVRGSRAVGPELHARARAGHRVEIPPHAVRLGDRELWQTGSVAPVPLSGGVGLLITLRECGEGAEGAAEDAMRTERSRSEAALRESEARYRTLFDSIDEGFCVVEVIFEGDRPVDYRFLEINGAFEKNTGLVNATGRLMRQMVPDHDESWFQIYGRIALTGEPIRFENRAEALGRDYDVYAFRVGAPDQRRVAILFNDVSERKRTERALRAERDFVTAVLDTIADLVVVLDTGGRIVRINKACEQATGFAPGEVTGKTMFELFLPEDEAAAREAFERVRSGGSPSRHRSRWRMRDGSERLFDWANTCIRDERGEVEFTIATGNDVTELVLAEQTLREREARFRAMGETVPYGVWLCDPQGGSEYVSQSFLDLLEMTQEEQREFGWTRRLPPEDVQPMLDRWLHCVRTGAPWDSEHRVLGPDGKYHHVLTRGLPVRDEDGRITCWVGINLDIDDRKKMEDEVREADRRKTDFLAVLSHELRNPLAPIRNSIYLLERAGSGTEQASRAKEVIRRQTEHLTRLIDDLLDVTRITRGKMVLQRTRCDLRDVVQSTTDDLHSVFAHAGLQLRVDHALGPVWIDADPTRIAQVLGNLLNNAAKFTARGDTVAVTLRAAAGWAELRVRDSGIGMEPATIERMFEPFAQGEQSLARTSGGLGLGLALVKGLVELHGGTIEARSDGVGRGAEFVVHLPLAGTVTGTVGPGRARAGARPRVILVVDDSVDTAQGLADILELNGHQVRIAGDGRSAIALAGEVRPEVILCDIGLPELDGYEVARALRRDEAFRATRLVALSGYAQPADRQRARDAGFDAHIAKPLDVDELMSLLADES